MKKILCAVMCMGLSASMYSDDIFIDLGKAIVDDAEDTENIVTHPEKDFQVVENAAYSAGQGVAEAAVEAVKNPTETLQTVGNDISNAAVNAAQFSKNVTKDAARDIDPVKTAEELGKQMRQNIQACEDGKDCVGNTMTTVVEVSSKACVSGAGDVEALGKTLKDGVEAGVADALSDEASCAEEEGAAE